VYLDRVVLRNLGVGGVRATSHPSPFGYFAGMLRDRPHTPPHLNQFGFFLFAKIGAGALTTSR
jgi:hypothetical protein